MVSHDAATGRAGIPQLRENLAPPLQPLLGGGGGEEEQLVGGVVDERAREIGLIGWWRSGGGVYGWSVGGGGGVGGGGVAVDGGLWGVGSTSLQEKGATVHSGPTN